MKKLTYLFLLIALIIFGNSSIWALSMKNGKILLSAHEKTSLEILSKCGTLPTDKQRRSCRIIAHKFKQLKDQYGVTTSKTHENNLQYTVGPEYTDNDITLGFNIPLAHIITCINCFAGEALSCNAQDKCNTCPGCSGN